VEGLQSAQNIQDLLEGKRPSLAQDVDSIFYQRPPGTYTDRQGKSYTHTVQDFCDRRAHQAMAAVRYYHEIDSGISEEDARDMIPAGYRQNWVMSCNVRSLMHLLDLRAKSDAQLECQQLCELIWPHFEAWVPAIADWYKKNRWGKARLSP
jgi:thymidylate synthase (FAD)